MGWRGQENRDEDERERRRAYVNGLPWLERWAVRSTDWMIVIVVAAVFISLTWAVVRGGE